MPFLVGVKPPTLAISASNSSDFVLSIKKLYLIPFVSHVGFFYVRFILSRWSWACLGLPTPASHSAPVLKVLGILADRFFLQTAIIKCDS